MRPIFCKIRRFFIILLKFLALFDFYSKKLLIFAASNTINCYNL